MADIRVVGMLSGEGTTVESLVRGGIERSVPIKVVGLVADKACNGITRMTSKYKIPGYIIPFRKDAREAWNHELVRGLDALRPDLICLAGFMHILGRNIVDRYMLRILNIHPGPLPLLAGKDPQKRAIEMGLKSTGNTVHIVTEKVDDDSHILATDTMNIEGMAIEHVCAFMTTAGHATYREAIWRWIKDYDT